MIFLLSLKWVQKIMNEVWCTARCLTAPTFYSPKQASNSENVSTVTCCDLLFIWCHQCAIYGQWATDLIYHHDSHIAGEGQNWLHPYSNITMKLGLDQGCLLACLAWAASLSKGCMSPWIMISPLGPANSKDIHLSSMLRTLMTCQFPCPPPPQSLEKWSLGLLWTVPPTPPIEFVSIAISNYPNEVMCS